MQRESIEMKILVGAISIQVAEQMKDCYSLSVNLNQGFFIGSITIDYY